MYWIFLPKASMIFSVWLKFDHHKNGTRCQRYETMRSTSCILHEPLSTKNSFIEWLYPPILPLSMFMFVLSMNSFCSNDVSVLKVEMLDCYEKMIISSHPPTVYYTFTSVIVISVMSYFLLYLLPPNHPLSSNIVSFKFLQFLMTYFIDCKDML